MKVFLLSLARDELNGPVYWLPKILTFILSCVYRMAVWMRNTLFDIGLKTARRLPVPVISVGNITMGGAGKTPLVEYIVQYLQTKGLRPAVLTRGYMPKKEVGGHSDEAQMLRRNLSGVPVIVGADRFKAATEFLSRESVDVFVLDDGFQRRQLHRDLDIVAVNARYPFGNGQLIPRGILREPVGSVRRADSIVVTGAGEDWRKTLEGIELDGSKLAACVLEPAVLSDLDHKAHGFPEGLKEKKVLAVCALAEPAGFISALKELQCAVVGQKLFLDHHIFERSDINEILNTAEHCGAECVVMTVKDAVKMERFASELSSNVQMLVLESNLKFLYGLEPFLERIDRCCTS